MPIFTDTIAPFSFKCLKYSEFKQDSILTGLCYFRNILLTMGKNAEGQKTRVISSGGAVILFFVTHVAFYDSL